VIVAMVAGLALLTRQDKKFALQTPFAVDGQILLCYDGRDIVSSLHTQVVCWKGTSGERIQDLNQLRGYVSIRTADEALSYARLLTSPVVECAAMELRRYEVVRKADFTQQYVFGNMDYYNRCRKASTTEYGIVTDAIMKQEHASPAHVQKVADHWLIERSLVGLGSDYRRLSIIDVSEDVWPDGRYERRERNERPTASSLWFLRGVAG